MHDATSCNKSQDMSNTRTVHVSTDIISYQVDSMAGGYALLVKPFILLFKILINNLVFK